MTILNTIIEWAMQLPWLKQFTKSTDDSTPSSSFIPTLWRNPRGWGNHISWFNWENREVVGHKQRTPKVGDLLLMEMKSDRIGVFRFIEIDQQRDPPDMFFGKVEDVGYDGDEHVKPILAKSKRPEKVMFLR